MKIKTKIVLAVLAIQCVFSQANTESDQVRSIRLENFINNYKGKTIRFKNENSRFIEGVLMEITDTDFVLSINNSATFYSHKNIDFVYLPPVAGDFYITAGVALLGGVAGYATTIIAHPNPSNSATGGFATLGTVLGFVIGKKAFYKQQKIDISGRLRG